jgi:hypothetical protein
MRLSACICVAALSGLGVLAFATDASAQDPSAPPVPAAAAPAPGAAPSRTDADKDDDDDKDLKRIGLELNPLGFAIGRYSINVEYMLARHHALILTPFYDSTGVTVNGADIATLNGFGAELGYRFYTGSKGMNGFYVGPSVLFASWSESSKLVGFQASDSFTAIGGALDIGGQAVIGPGVIVGGGFGLQYTKNSVDINTDSLNIASAAIAGGGVRPRFLLSVGYGF